MSEVQYSQEQAITCDVKPVARELWELAEEGLQEGERVERGLSVVSDVIRDGL